MNDETYDFMFNERFKEVYRGLTCIFLAQLIQIGLLIALWATR